MLERQVNHRDLKLQTAAYTNRKQEIGGYRSTTRFEFWPYLTAFVEWDDGSISKKQKLEHSNFRLRFAFACDQSENRKKFGIVMFNFGIILEGLSISIFEQLFVKFTELLN